jgi:hypothetical protein
MEYTVFDAITGKILKAGTCIETDAQIQIPEGSPKTHVIIEGFFRDDMFEIEFDEDGFLSILEKNDPEQYTYELKGKL